MNLLYICDKKQYNNKLDRNRFHSVNHISQHPSVAKLYWWGIGWDGYNNELSLNDNIINKFKDIHFNCILMYQPRKYKKQYPKNTVICCTFNEMYKPLKVIPDLNNITLALCHHSNEIDLYSKNHKNILFKYIPHCADETIFKPLNMANKYDFTLVGNISKKIYPLRNRLAAKIFPILVTKGYKCYIHDHPGYNIEYNKIDKILNEYVSVINNTWICCSDCSVFKYRLSKYIEIPLCKTAFAGDIPKDDELFFRKFMIEINNNMTDEKIVSILEKSINNKNYLKLHAKIGYNMCLKYTQRSYANRFLHIIKIYEKMNNYKFYHKLKNIKYKVIDVFDRLNINEEECIVGNHSIWFPKLKIKIPFQYKGKITKYINPPEQLYEREHNIINELTILTVLNKIKMAPKINGLIYIKNFITNYPTDSNVDNFGVYGYKMKDVTNLKCGKFNIHKIKQLPIKCSNEALTDIVNNVINGYVIDIRRSGADTYKWVNNFVKCDFSIPD